MNFHKFFHFAISLLSVLIVGVSRNAAALDGVVINEISYHPSEDYPFEYEFIELYNPTSSPIDLSGYAFTEGIIYRIPDGTILQSRAYLVVVRDPSNSIWNNRTRNIVGPFVGDLDNGGERIRFRSPLGEIADEVRYDDLPPWPRGADGLGSTLERVSAEEPSNSPYSWRSSEVRGGTPRSINSVATLPARPVAVSWSVSPPHPQSVDTVRVEVRLEGGNKPIRQVDLRYEVWTTSKKNAMKTVQMAIDESADGLLHYSAEIPANPSQSLVRFNWRILFQDDGSSVYLPHSAEPRPFESYFVYDSEIPSRFPILWMFPELSTSLPPSLQTIRGVVVKPLESENVKLYDGAKIENSLVDSTGRKIRFLKGEEYRNDRTINLNPESPTHPNSGGADTNHKEHLGNLVFRDQGVLAPRCDWFRVIENGVMGQRTATQQVNEKFLENNDLDPTANIYKIAYNEPNTVPGFSIHYSKQTNLETGSDDLTQLFRNLNLGTETEKKEAVLRYLELDRVIGYSVAGVLISNWDGFFNNMFLIHTPFPIDTWQCVPWDLDKTFGYTDGYPPTSTTFAEMPLEFPLDGQARLASRTPGYISRPVHRVAEFNEIYLQRMRDALNSLFSLESMNRRIDEIEALLLDDLQLEANYTGVYRTTRKKQIESAYDTIRTFLALRHAYLRPLLFTPVENWSLY